MTSRSQRRWLPAFSVRSLLIAMTLLCGYAACWWPTKTQGEDDVGLHTQGLSAWAPHPEAVAPLVISSDDGYFADGDLTRRYYFWFFGYVAKLPYERAIASDVPEVDVQIRIDAANSDIDKANFGLPETGYSPRRGGRNELPESDTP